MSEYVILLDPVRAGTIVKTEGRRHYRFCFGPFSWEQTTIFLPYLTQGTEVCGLWAPLTEEEALDRLKLEARRRADCLKAVIQAARQALPDQTASLIERAGQLLPDWDERLAMYLAALPSTDGALPELPGPVIRAAELLRRYPRCDRASLLALRRLRLARQARIALLTAWYDELSMLPPNRQDTQRLKALKDARKVLMGDTDDILPQSVVLSDLHDFFPG